LRNLSREYLKAFKKPLSYYDGCCDVLCEDTLIWLDKTAEKHPYRTLRIDFGDGVLLPITDHKSTGPWFYHAVIYDKGLVHCGWMRRVYRLDTFLLKVFPHNTSFRISILDKNDKDSYKFFKEISKRDIRDFDIKYVNNTNKVENDFFIEFEKRKVYIRKRRTNDKLHLQ
jgi:hypothetical protein